MHIRSRNHNQKSRRTELFVFVTAPWCLPGPDQGPGPGPALAWNSSPLLETGGTSMPRHLPGIPSWCQPLSLPHSSLAKALGHSLEEALRFSVSLAGLSPGSPASKLHRLPSPPAQLLLDGEHAAQAKPKPIPVLGER